MELTSEVLAQKIFITGTEDAELNGNIITVSCTAPVEITNVTITNSGYGGICVKSGADVTLGERAAVSGNRSTGVEIESGGKLTMKSGAKINKNAGALYGGVKNAGGTFIMEGGEISENESQGLNGGSGVYVSGSGGRFTMSGGTISNNTAKKNGGGVYVVSGRFTMTGGTISGNTAPQGQGGGVYAMWNSFTMGDSAFIPAGDDGTNDVYLYSSDSTTTIKIASTLTAESPVATITPAAYTQGAAVLERASNSTTTISANYEKFAVTAESDGTKWLIAEDGTLKSSVPEGFVRVKGGTVEGKDNTDNYAGVFIAGRTVTLKSFYMCDHEVTQGEWEDVMTGNSESVSANPSLCSAGSTEYAVNFGTEQNNRPVDNVTWYDAVYYCNIRSEQEGLTKAYDISGITQSGGHITAATVSLVSDADGYRLPTEAEWEYAARGGDPNAAAWDYTFSGAATASGVDYTSDGNSGMDSVGWYSWNNKDGTTGAASVTGDASGKGTHEVKQRTANALGIYDMSGNVYEWCWDWYGTVASDTPAAGSASGSNRVNRGGAWSSNANRCSVSYRSSSSPSNRSSNVGFRVVRSSSK